MSMMNTLLIAVCAISFASATREACSALSVALCALDWALSAISPMEAWVSSVAEEAELTTPLTHLVVVQ